MNVITCKGVINPKSENNIETKNVVKLAANIELKNL